MRRAKYILYVLYMLHAVTLSGQSRSELRDMFISAEGDLLFEDYAEALPKYLNLLQIYPENYNFYFRAGQCYLNTPGEKDKSIPFLETAAKNINPAHRPGSFRETGAPYDVLYHLANAYRINNQLDKALETYDLFLRD
nr:tetratricopeptide repeat protein [Bacteroidales bacterium]